MFLTYRFSGYSYASIQQWLQTQDIKVSERSVERFLKKYEGEYIAYKETQFMQGLYEHQFFKIGVKLACDQSIKWNPLDETLKTFMAKHESFEVIYFENEVFEDIILLFRERFSKYSLAYQH